MKTYWSLPPSQFNGLPARCAPGTHEAAIDLISKNVSTKGSVLDLAAGTGAFLARLRQHGFTDLSAAELDLDAFRFPAVSPISVDLNSDFSDEFHETFKLVTAIEIIEHLDSPRHFLKQIWNLLEPNGHLLVSTPNIAHWVGRLRFVTRGEHRYFKESDYHQQRHISPISDLHMRLMLKEIGFELVERATAGSFYGPLKHAVAAPAALLSRIFFGPLSSGDVCMYLAGKREPDRQSSGRNSIVYTSRGRREAEPVA
jgi:2-polyprenyl-3-methyl-5-hydroxy-6-metoxy-1,4-benzoquinol methylase